MTRGKGLVAFDVGNTRVKCGRFTSFADPLPTPVDALSFPAEASDFLPLRQWLADFDPRLVAFRVGSVNRPASGRLVEWIRGAFPASDLALMAAFDLPIVVRLPSPDRVGIDRLLDAVGANAIRPRDRAAVVVDVGTAITVDLLSRDGEFLGGAIVPGHEIASQALHDYTDMLPKVDFRDTDEPPTAVGTDTIAAIRAGLFWSSVGAIRAIYDEQVRHAGDAALILTGGGAEQMAPLIERGAIVVPQLTLGGIAVAFREGA